MARVVCRDHRGVATYSYLTSLNPPRGRYHYMLERHMRGCSCSFCDRRFANLGYRRPFSFKLNGIGWNMIGVADPWSRWYFRWARVRGR